MVRLSDCKLRVQSYLCRSAIRISCQPAATSKIVKWSLGLVSSAISSGLTFDLLTSIKNAHCKQQKQQQWVCKLMQSSSTSRYDHLNVSALESMKSYSDIPALLRNRPLKFTEHCLKWMPPAVDITYTYKVQKLDPEHFKYKVKRTVTNSQYMVYMAATTTVTAPWCDCNLHHLPCKHILCVSHHFPIEIGRGIHYLRSIHHFLISHSILDWRRTC